MANEPSGSETSQRTKACLTYTRSPKQRIDACNWLIKNAGLEGTQLALAYAGLGDSKRRSTHYSAQEALKDLDQALKLAPDLPRAHFWRGHALRYGLKDMATAKQSYELAFHHADTEIRSDPENANAYLLRSLAANALEDRHQAFEDINKAISLQPDMAAFYQVRAHFNLSAHKFEQSLADFTQSITLDPDSGDYFFRGQVSTSLGRYKDAIADYSILIDASELPESYMAFAHNSRAWAYFLSGESAKGLPDAQKAHALEPDNMSILDTLAQIQIVLGQLDKAKSNLDTVIAKQPDRHAYSYLGRGHLYELEGELQKAIASYEKVLTIGSPDKSNDTKLAHERARQSLKRLKDQNNKKQID